MGFGGFKFIRDLGFSWFKGLGSNRGLRVWSLRGVKGFRVR